MSNTPNPLQALISLLGQTPAAGTSPLTPSTPSAGTGAAVPQSAAPPQMPIQQLMQASQSALQSPMGQPVGGAGGIINAMQHPLVGALIKGLANAMQSFGWTAMMPQEREERTQLQQQKAETLARLAETGAYEQGMLGFRQGELGTMQQKADIFGQEANIKAQHEQFTEGIQKDALALRQQLGEANLAIRQGQLDKGYAALNQQATQFEQRLQQQRDLTSRGLDLKTEGIALEGMGMQIKQGMLNLAQSALSQKGTEAGVATLTKLQQFQLEHPIMSQLIGMQDLTSMVSGAQGAGVAGIAPRSAAPAAPTGGGMIFARDPSGKLHQAPAGTPLPRGWTQGK